MATVTRSELMARMVRRIGGRTGTIGAGSSTTTVVLGGLVGTTGDNTYYAGDRLIMPDQGAEADKERLVTNWNDATGVATVSTMTGAPSAGTNYMLVNREDYTLNELRLALDKCLRMTKRTYRLVVPLTPYLRMYPLIDAPWLEGDGDIDGAWFNTSPIALQNEDFSLWFEGANAAPDGWTLSGAGASVARLSNGIRSAFSAELTSASAAAQLRQSMPETLVQWITRRTFPVYTPIRAAAWVVCSTANVARVGVYDGSTTTWSGYHTGSGVPEYLSLTLNTTATQTEYTLVLEVATGTNVAQFHAAVLMQNTLSAPENFGLKDRGSQMYIEQPLTMAVRNIGGVPTIELGRDFSTYGQMVVYTRRRFPEFTSDADVIEEQYAKAIEAGGVRWLLDAVKPQQDRKRLDVIMAEDARRWTRAATNFIDLPVPVPPVQRTIMGA